MSLVGCWAEAVPAEISSHVVLLKLSGFLQILLCPELGDCGSLLLCGNGSCGCLPILRYHWTSLCHQLGHCVLGVRQPRLVLGIVLFRLLIESLNVYIPSLYVILLR